MHAFATVFNLKASGYVVCKAQRVVASESRTGTNVIEETSLDVATFGMLLAVAKSLSTIACPVLTAAGSVASGSARAEMNRLRQTLAGTPGKLAPLVFEAGGA